MKPAPFAWRRVAEIDEAIAALAAAGGAAKLTAGGQSLGPMLNLRLARPSLLIDISRIEALNRIEVSDQQIRIGAAVTHARIEDELAQTSGAQPLARAARGIAYRAVRNRGTIGGSLAHADPAAHWPLVLAALGASIEVNGRQGVRLIPAERFVRGAYLTELAADELIGAVRVPRLRDGTRWAYRKFCRKPGEFAEAQAACLFDPTAGVARILLGTPAASPTALAALADRVASGSPAERSLERLAAAVDGVLPAVAPDRRQAVIVMLDRALREAFE